MGGKVVVECPEGIPCDPCATSCPFGAISKKTITSLPEIEESKCTGCTICVSTCPGLAIFVIEGLGEKTRITLPYEFLPLPEKGQEVKVLSREGKAIGSARVVRVLTKGRDRTAAITLETSSDIASEVRNFRI
jgi:Fe-S-cluster-containing hydrogenase component 2